MPATSFQGATQRSLALCLSVVLTLAMLGGIHVLSLPDDAAAAGMASSSQATQPRA